MLRGDPRAVRGRARRATTTTSSRCASSRSSSTRARASTSRGRSATASCITPARGCPRRSRAEIVRLADRIAYVSHDIDDAVRGGVLSEDDLPTAPAVVLGTTHGSRIRTMVQDTIATSRRRRRHPHEPAGVGRDDGAAGVPVRQRVPLAQGQGGGAQGVRGGARAVHALPASIRTPCPRSSGPSTPAELPQRVTDYLAGMTDRYALRCYEQLFMPSSWRM